ncbi:MAG: polysaccharide biosynthesis/export family protein [Planctomycetota bacterium]
MRTAAVPKTRRHERSPMRLLTAAGGLASLGAVLGGCNFDSFIDPSVTGRWEETPTIVPILENIAAIEEGVTDELETTPVTETDLLPEPELYIVGPGDVLDLTLFDLVNRGQELQIQRAVDINGFIEIPQLGRIYVGGQDEEQVTETIRGEMRRFIADPLISVTIPQRRRQTYSVLGSVQDPGQYFIPSSDYRLLEAVVAAGGVAERQGAKLLVIRQVGLEAGVRGVDGSGLQRQPQDRLAPPTTPQRQGDDQQDVLDLIDDIIGAPPGGSPGLVASRGAGSQPARVQPNRPTGDRPPIDLIGEESVPAAPVAQPDRQAPVIELVDPVVPGDRPRSPADRGGSGPGGWVFLDGQWVRADRPRGVGGTPVSDDGAPGDGLVSQRIIEVPVKPLLAGDARYNIVVRPGDIIRVPPPDVGNVYVGGFVNRPGVYQLPFAGRLTLRRAITAAGGLSGVAIPERCDLTRMVGPDREATIMLNLRAIAEGTQPDVYLKPDDHINIGTNFWALPLAVIRGGFRASYGFGFLLDRNFGNDVFGPPPLAAPGG